MIKRDIELPPGLIYYNTQDIPHKPGIYVWIHKKTFKMYWGESGDLNDRRIQHIKIKKNYYFHNALTLYGLEEFDFMVIHVFDYNDKEERLWIEANYIECYETYLKQFGYNIQRYGDGATGVKYSKKSKEQMSKSRLELFKNGYINPRKGAKHTEESKKIISLKHIGMKYSLETIEKRNKTRIERGVGIGKNNSMFDSTIYKFKNIKNNEEFVGTKFDFYKKYNLEKTMVYMLVSGKIKTLKKEWIFII